MPDGNLYTPSMKALTVRLPASLIADIETEAHCRGCSKSDIVRERLQRARLGARTLRGSRWMT
jgi:hypothetical protein